ncbi:MAG: glycoside hydrolase family 28 protein [Sphaerochaeta sp.]|uniref:glycoside hydrolase family 28 protein n=1 Tax=Sphaerochaeta sp. TaxID=1972642 RepID=UPI002CC5E5BE|nr:glycoside hydrolase family 28 protein [Sphaerochaeta sp.]
MREFTLRSFKAVGDGLNNDSEAFAKAFHALADGGVLRIEAGTYLTGPLHIRAKNLVVEMERGAVIQFIDEETLYRPVYSRWEGVNCYCMHPCLLIEQSDGLLIRGEGILDGNGRRWWEAANRKRNTQKGPVSPLEHELARLNPGYESQSGGGGGRQSQFLRPPLVQILHSNNVKLEGLTLQNSPFWTLHPLYSTNLVFMGLKVLNPKDAPNTDGIDVDSCRFVTIKDCLVDVGDDGIALKSGSGPDGVATNAPTTDILIEDCTVKSAHGGAVIGSETAAGIRDVRVRNCLFDGTDRGIRIKTRRGRGGVISNLHFDSVRMRNNLCPLTLNMYYRCGSLDREDFSLEKREITSTTPSIERIVIENCTSEDSTSSAAFIVGLPESPIRDLVIRNCSFTVAKTGLTPVDESEMYEGLSEPEGRGIRLRNVELSVENVQVKGVETALVVEDGVELKS